MQKPRYHPIHGSLVFTQSTWSDRVPPQRHLQEGNDARGRAVVAQRAMVSPGESTLPPLQDKGNLRSGYRTTATLRNSATPGRPHGRESGLAPESVERLPTN
jgi:hypothetical protein